MVFLGAWHARTRASRLTDGTLELARAAEPTVSENEHRSRALVGELSESHATACLAGGLSRGIAPLYIYKEVLWPPCWVRRLCGDG